MRTIAGKFIGIGCAISALGGSATGIGIVFAGFLNAYSRNPSRKSSLFGYAILGFALAEARGLFALRRAFLLLFW